MLRGISPLISPELLKTLHEMGHGDEIVLADAHFPGHTLGRRTLRADGLTIALLLDAIAPLFVLDQPGNPLTMMQPENPADLDASVSEDFMRAIRRHCPDALEPRRVERAAFYDQARAAYVVLQTGESRPFGNIILKKGVTV